MITETLTVSASELAATAAASAATTILSSEPLRPGARSADTDVFFEGKQAVLVSFSGAISGELAVVVDDELTSALADSTIGPIDLAQALTPTLQSIAAALGPVVLDAAQAMDARLALHRVLAHDNSALVPLVGEAGPRVGIAVGVSSTSAAATPHVTEPVMHDLSAQRLDLLRGVEMDATAELGRARMTVNDLLSLRTGAVIELDRAAGAPADLYVNGRLIARGEVVVVDENYGLRITQVVTDDTGR